LASKIGCASFFSAPALLSIRDPTLILIVPIGVISTAWIGKPAASTPAMARTMSPGARRRGPWFLFLFGILRGGTRCHAISTNLIATVVCCSKVRKFRRAIMSFDTCGIRAHRGFDPFIRTACIHAYKREILYIFMGSLRPHLLVCFASAGYQYPLVSFNCAWAPSRTQLNDLMELFRRRMSALGH
jgi:hypothetical protein